MPVPLILVPRFLLKILNKSQEISFMFRPKGKKVEMIGHDTICIDSEMVRQSFDT